MPLFERLASCSAVAVSPINWGTLSHRAVLPTASPTADKDHNGGSIPGIAPASNLVSWWGLQRDWTWNVAPSGSLISFRARSHRSQCRGSLGSWSPYMGNKVWLDLILEPAVMPLAMHVWLGKRHDYVDHASNPIMLLSESLEEPGRQLSLYV